MKRLLILLLLFSLAFSQSQLMTETTNWAQFIQGLLIGLVMLAVILSILAYVAAGFFGAETRATIQLWAQNLLAASFISLIVLLLLNFLMPSWQTGAVPYLDIESTIKTLIGLARDALLDLIILLTIISVVVYVIGQIFGAETRARANTWAQVTIASAMLAAVIYALIEMIIITIIRIPLPIEDIYKSVLAGIVVLVTLIVLITYLGARVFRIPEWEAYLSIELSDLFTSLLVVLFVFGLFYASTEFANELVRSSGIAKISNAKSAPQAAAILLGGIIRDVENARTDMYTIQMCSSLLNLFYKRTGESALNTTYKVLPGLEGIISTAGIIASSLIMLEGSLKAQLFLIQIIDATAVVLLLPAGAILRFFPPTKDAGSFLLAVAIGLQIVFPLTYVINEIVFKEIGVEYQKPTALVSMLCGFNFFAASVPALLIPRVVGLFSSTAASALSVALNVLLSETTLQLIKIGDYMAVIDYTAKVSLFGFFAPSISMVFTVAFINALTKFIIRRD